MSYCRWSSPCGDGTNSDIYCYYSTENQYIIHIASHRVVNISDAPVIDWDAPPHITHKQYCARVGWMKQEAIRSPVGLPYDGKSFYCDTKEECIATLEMLVGAGYNLPEYVIESILEEEE